MMRRLFLPVILLWLSLALAACGSADLSLLNEVKRFEPEWMDLSEQVTEVSRLLRRTEISYGAFMDFMGPRVQERGGSDDRTRYGRVVEQRDQLAKDFETQRKDFEEAVQDFNQWQNDLMQDKVDETLAYESFRRYQKTYQNLYTSIGQLEQELHDNIEESNNLVRQICRSLNSLRADEYTIDPSY